MHLGRFHAVVDSLVHHFRTADLANKIEVSAAALDAYASNRSDSQVEAFNGAIRTLRTATEVDDGELTQPYAREVIAQLGLDNYVGPALAFRVQHAIGASAFDHAGLATKLREIGADVTKKVKQLDELHGRELEPEVIGEAIAVAAHLLIEPLGALAVEARQKKLRGIRLRASS